MTTNLATRPARWRHRRKWALWSVTQGRAVRVLHRDLELYAFEDQYLADHPTISWDI